MNKRLVAPLLLAGLLCHSIEGQGAGYYLCVDPKTGKKSGQEQPCEPGKELGSYAPVSPNEQRARDEAARQSKREFERLRPGTYAPEEYMNEEELADYRAKSKDREDERRRQDAERTAKEALLRAERAERLASDAEAKAKAAEEAAAQNRATYPYLPYLPPRPYPPRSPPRQGHASETQEFPPSPQRQNQGR